MYIALILFSLLLGVVLGVYMGYYVTLSILSVKALDANLKVMRWESNLFAYRPRSITKPISEGDIIAIKADEGIVNFVNILIEKDN